MAIRELQYKIDDIIFIVLYCIVLYIIVPPDIKDEETVSDITVKEGENATLACKAKGNPLPKITWKREDGQKIVMKNKPKKMLSKELRYYVLFYLLYYSYNMFYIIAARPIVFLLFSSF